MLVRSRTLTRRCIICGNIPFWHTRSEQKTRIEEETATATRTQQQDVPNVRSRASSMCARASRHVAVGTQTRFMLWHTHTHTHAASSALVGNAPTRSDPPASRKQILLTLHPAPKLCVRMCAHARKPVSGYLCYYVMMICDACHKRLCAADVRMRGEGRFGESDVAVYFRSVAFAALCADRGPSESRECGCLERSKLS